MAWKVGAIARQTGVSVRTLHWYDEVGLLRPSGRTAAGHRLYSDADLVRLHRIRLLQKMGLSLDRIRAALEEGQADPGDVLRVQLEHLEAEIESRARLAERIRGILRWSAGSKGEIPAGAVLEAIREMETMEEQFTMEQSETLAERREMLGEETIRQVEAEWPRLIAAMKDEMEKGTDPADPEVQRLAARWRELVEMFTGRDVGIAAAVGRVYEKEPRVRQKTGLTSEIMGYVSRAWGAGS